MNSNKKEFVIKNHNSEYQMITKNNHDSEDSNISAIISDNKIENYEIDENHIRTRRFSAIISKNKDSHSRTV